MVNYTIYIGQDNRSQLTLDPTLTLANLRKTLGNAVNSDFRFLNYQNNSIYYTDMIIGLANESFIPISAIRGQMNQIYLTNVKATMQADLIGFRNSWFWDRLLGVKITLNNESGAQSANQGKMQPLMLSNVKLANPDTRGAGAMENVLICQKDTVVSFSLNSWGAAAYGYDIRAMSGTPITETPLYICFSDCSNSNRRIGGLSKYYTPSNGATNNKMIKIVPVSTMTLNNGQTLSYMKFVVKSWVVTSYTAENGTVYNCNAPIPNTSASILGRSVGISAGTSVPTTKPSGQAFNGPIHNIKENKDLSGTLGEIVFYTFVFDSQADADRVFKGVNTPLDSVWVV